MNLACGSSWIVLHCPGILGLQSNRQTINHSFKTFGRFVAVFGHSYGNVPFLGLMALLDLPPEVILLVIELLWQEDLHRVSLVCKSLQVYAQPHLYKNIVFNGRLHNELDPPPICRLLSTLMRKSELATYVKSVAFVPNDFYSSWREVAPLTAEDLQAAQELTATIGVPNFLSPTLKSGNFGVALRLLIFKIQGLERIDFGGSSLNNRHFSPFKCFADLLFNLVDSLDSNDGAISALYSLKEIIYQPTHRFSTKRGQVFTSNQMLRFFSLPALQSLKVRAFVYGAVEFGHESLQISSLTSLELAHSQVAEDTLAWILQFALHLRVFRYHFVCRVAPRRDTSQNYLQCSALSQALQHVRSTLHELILVPQFCMPARYHHTWVGERGKWGPRGVLAGLEQFTSLEHLEVPLVLLLGWDPAIAPSLAKVLPPTLRTFCCSDTFDDWDDCRWTEETDVITQIEGYLKDNVSAGLAKMVLKYDSRSVRIIWSPVVCYEFAKAWDARKDRRLRGKL